MMSLFNRRVTQSTLTLAAVFAAFAFIACSPNDFSTVSSQGNNAVAACTTGTVYDSTTGTCVATSTATTTATATPTATPTTAATATPAPDGQCDAGYVESDSYGCIPQNSCADGQGWYNGACIQLHGSGAPSLCQDFCPIGMTNTPYGCLPQIHECPPCTGVHHGYCYWGVDYLNWYYGH